MTDIPTSPFSKKLFGIAFLQAFKKLNPYSLLQNPVIFLSEIGALISTIEWLFLADSHIAFYAQISIWLWLTVLFANFAESIAEARNQAQAEPLRYGRMDIMANLQQKDGSYSKVNCNQLKKGDIVQVSVGETVPGDGEIVEGMGSVDESAVTGESAPVIRAYFYFPCRRCNDQNFRNVFQNRIFRNHAGRPFILSDPFLQ